jgi:hypothetical protein
MGGRLDLVLVLQDFSIVAASIIGEKQLTLVSNMLAES